jgi:hypothetical protein
MKDRFRRGMVNRAEALHAAQVMDPVHQEDSTRRSRGTGVLERAAGTPGSVQY